MKEYTSKPDYIQVHDNGMVWDWPHTHTFYPSDFGKDLDKAYEEVIWNNYEPVCRLERAMLFKKKVT